MSQLEHPKRRFVKTITILKTTFNITKIIGESYLLYLSKKNIQNLQNVYHIIMLLFQNAFKGWNSFLFLFVGWRRPHFSFGIYWLQIHATAASTVEHRLKSLDVSTIWHQGWEFQLDQMATVDGRHPAPIEVGTLSPLFNDQVLYIPGGSEFLPSTVP